MPDLAAILKTLTAPVPAAAICYALAYLVGLGAFAWIAYRRGLATAGIKAVAVAGLMGGLVGANAAQWLASGAPGKTALGGIAGGYLTVALYKRHLGLRRPTGDLFAVAVCAGEAVGRWGCFFGGCCYGRPTDAPFAVYQHDALRHPTQIYLSVACFLILWAMYLFHRFVRPPENGLFFLHGLLYCAARFVIESYREGTALALSLTLAQWACLIGAAFFGARLTRLLQDREAVSHERDAAAMQPLPSVD
jgi:phosphatidylglycerol---prolipoprotein diacylglyceryl transferase